MSALKCGRNIRKIPHWSCCWKQLTTTLFFCLFHQISECSSPMREFPIHAPISRHCLDILHPKQGRFYRLQQQVGDGIVVTASLYWRHPRARYESCPPPPFQTCVTALPACGKRWKCGRTIKRSGLRDTGGISLVSWRGEPREMFTQQFHPNLFLKLMTFYT